MQEIITMACEECKQRNYTTKRTKRPNQERLAIKKYCKFCRKRTAHKETR
ncbi:TPA: 50S ribosomal protein L33 [bacterium]|nr:MAG: 50S ribosomal protein L33 [Candidatus Hydrogenedentes bacterium CG07_land_8_20_14_0_80_42_17]HBW46673.1 50S ribosomal protein L33 [bacterium]